jgi:hypothetical protein
VRTTTFALIVWLVMVAGQAYAQTAASDCASSAADPSCDRTRLYVKGEYLLWWTKDAPAPVPLVSTGLIGAPGTRILLGGEDVDTAERQGARFTVGGWLTSDFTWGAEARYFFLPTTSATRSVSSSGASGSPTLLIPFFDVTIPGESSTFLSLPGSFSGTATEHFESRFQGAELSAVKSLASSARWRAELLAGFRWIDLGEKYRFSTSSPNIPPATDIFMTRDVFDTTNRFYGGQVGLRGEYRYGAWLVGSGARLGLGTMHQTVDIDGVLVANTFNGGGSNPLQTFPGGYFAQPTNMGLHSRTVFAAVPEANAEVGYRLTSWAQIYVGYTFLYLSNVARPSDQIDRSINPTQNASFGGAPPPALVGEARPAFRFRSSDFWAQGLSLAVVLRY